MLSCASILCLRSQINTKILILISWEAIIMHSCITCLRRENYKKFFFHQMLYSSISTLVHTRYTQQTGVIGVLFVWRRRGQTILPYQSRSSPVHTKPCPTSLLCAALRCTLLTRVTSSKPRRAASSLLPTEGDKSRTTAALKHHWCMSIFIFMFPSQKHSQVQITNNVPYIYNQYITIILYIYIYTQPYRRAAYRV